MPGRVETKYTLTPEAIAARARQAQENATISPERVTKHLQEAIIKYIDWYGNWEEARVAWEEEFPNHYAYALNIRVSDHIGNLFTALAYQEDLNEGTAYTLETQYDGAVSEQDPHSSLYIITMLQPEYIEYIFSEIHEQSIPVWEEHREYTPKPGASQYDQQTEPQDEAAEQLSEGDAALQALRAELLEEMRTTQGRNGPLYTALDQFTAPWFGSHEREGIAPILPGEFITILETIFAAFGLQKYQNYSTGTVNGSRQCVIIRPEQRAAFQPIVERLVGLLIELQKIDPSTLSEAGTETDAQVDEPIASSTAEHMDTTDDLVLNEKGSEEESPKAAAAPAQSEKESRESSPTELPFYTKAIINTIHHELTSFVADNLPHLRSIKTIASSPTALTDLMLICMDTAVLAQVENEAETDDARILEERAQRTQLQVVGRLLRAALRVRVVDGDIHISLRKGETYASAKTKLTEAIDALSVIATTPVSEEVEEQHSFQETQALPPGVVRQGRGYTIYEADTWHQVDRNERIFTIRGFDVRESDVDQLITELRSEADLSVTVSYFDESTPIPFMSIGEVLQAEAARIAQMLPSFDIVATEDDLVIAYMGNPQLIEQACTQLRDVLISELENYRPPNSSYFW